MATSTQINALTALYVGYFDRAPDPAGLQFWIEQIDNGREFNTIAADFAASPEAVALYPYLTTPAVSSPAAFITSIYANLFGRAPDAAGLEFWTGVLNDGSVSVADMIEAIIMGARDDATAGTFDKTVLDNKVEVGLDFASDAANTSGFEFDAAAKSAAVAAVNGVTEDEATVVAAKAGTDAFLTGAANQGNTFTLTTGIDTLVGTAGNDTFNATETATSAVLGGLDNVDGGEGKDTLNIADTSTAATAQFSLPAGFTLESVENLSVVTNGGIDMDVSGIAGLEAVKTAAAGTANTEVTAAGTTNVTTTVAGTATTTVIGGKVVSATAGTGAVDISGSKLESVSVKGGDLSGTDAIDNGTATTLTAVTLDNLDAGATSADLNGNGIATLTLKNQDSEVDVAITNTVSKDLTVNLENVGYDATGAAVADVDVTTGAAAETVTINTASKSNATLNSGGAVKTVNLAGSGDLVLGGLGAIATATKVDGSTATGNLTLGSLNAAAVNVSTGAGNDSFEVNATAKANVASGAGNDTVTLGSVLAAGSDVNMGAGDDTLLGGTTLRPAASTATNVTKIDGGEGTDSVSSALINVGNAAQFVNFENVSLDGGSLDLDLMTGSTITGLSIDTADTTTVTNATTAQSLTVNADATGGTSTIGFKGVAGSSDAYSINFDAKTAGTATSPATVDAGAITINGIENVTINSGSEAGVNANAITLTDNALQTLSITGDQALTVGFSGAVGTVTGAGVSSIDGSAATGKLAIDLDGVTAAATGLTVQGGSAVDTLTTDEFAATLTGNGGLDKFDVTKADANATDAASAVVTTITDLVVGETIQFEDVGAGLTPVGTSSFTATKVDVSAATNLDEAIDAATAANVTAGDAVFTWFNYGSDTYLVQDVSTATTLTADDSIVKLTGGLDLSGSSVTDGDLFTFA